MTTEFNGSFHWLEVRRISQVPDESYHEKPCFLHMRKTDADQPANPCSLIIVFVNRCLDKTKHQFSISEIPSLLLEFLAYQTSLCFTWPKNPKAGFLIISSDDKYGTCWNWPTKRSNEPHREITNEMVCAPSKDADQPGHLPSLTDVQAD